MDLCSVTGIGDTSGQSEDKSVLHLQLCQVSEGVSLNYCCVGGI